jgi:hypothetical protein
LLASNIAENEWWAETAAGDARASTATPASHKPERAFIATLGTLEIIVRGLLAVAWKSVLTPASIGV